MNSAVSQAIELVEGLPEIEARLAGASTTGLFLDFDGTISPIVPSPADAEMDPAIRPILERLVRRPDFVVGIVTGRALDDVRQRAAIPGLFYVGNHGLEIERKGEYFRDPHADALKPELRRISLQLQLALADIQGVEIEDKGITLSVHFRRVAAELHPWIEETVLEAVKGSAEFTAKPGKRVVEVRPQLPVSKGTAVKQLVSEMLPASALPIYIGDDVSDEDAFAAIPAGITVRVGDALHTRAKYVVPDVSGVAQFLDWLTRTKAHGSLARSQHPG